MAFNRPVLSSRSTPFAARSVECACARLSSIATYPSIHSSICAHAGRLVRCERVRSGRPSAQLTFERRGKTSTRYQYQHTSSLTTHSLHRKHSRIANPSRRTRITAFAIEPRLAIAICLASSISVSVHYIQGSIHSITVTAICWR